MASSKIPFERLPKNVQPIHYDLSLTPNLNDFTYKGSVLIQCSVLQDTNFIICNASKIRIHQIECLEEKVESFHLVQEQEILSLKFSSLLKKNSSLTLEIVFEGSLDDNMTGFYRSKYSIGSQSRYCAVTQFEATHARECFPCWDEPSLKATFSVTLYIPKDRMALSNMPIEKEEEIPNTEKKSVTFFKTPIMSTYLLAFAIGEFDFLESQCYNVQLRVYVLPGKTELASYALENNVRALEYFTEFFGVPYPLPKYDCLAVPDFSSGAMENWGLVTFREQCINYDPKNSSSSSKQYIAMTLNHEMAHQWFGNLVTMEWWTHLWLNEGFASFMENTATDALYPEYEIWPQFIVNTLISALESDALHNSHPIEVPVGHPSEVEEIFDNISYNKGASIIRMLCDYLGDEAFRKGMTYYLNKHSYRNTSTDDLWASLEETSRKPIGSIMSTWTSQMGFPLISVSSKVGDSGNTRNLSLTQTKFGSVVKPETEWDESENSIWKVPIKILMENSSKEILFETSSLEITLDSVSSSDWFKLNQGFIGYYRVLYSYEDYEAFKEPLLSLRLPQEDRLNLLDDVFALVQAGILKANIALSLLETFINEESYIVWGSIVSFFVKLDGLLSSSSGSLYGEFKAWVVRLMSKIVAKVGWNKSSESHSKTLLRQLVLRRVGLYGHEETISEARRRFEDHYDKKSIIPPDYRRAVYTIVMTHGNRETYEKICQMFQETDLCEEKKRLAEALGYCQQLDVLQDVMSFSFSDNIRSQDFPFVFGSIANNPIGKDLAWNFFKENYDELFARYNTGALMRIIISYVLDLFSSSSEANEASEFFDNLKINPGERTIKQGLESIRLKASWIDRDFETISHFFSSK